LPSPRINRPPRSLEEAETAARRSSANSGKIKTSFDSKKIALAIATVGSAYSYFFGQTPAITQSLTQSLIPISSNGRKAAELFSPKPSSPFLNYMFAAQHKPIAATASEKIIPNIVTPSAEPESSVPANKTTSPIEKPVKQPEKIHIFTSYTKDTPLRLPMSRKVMRQQKAYCKDKGYRYSVYEKNLALEKPSDRLPLPYWSKIAGINRLLKNDSESDWIVWLDDDAVILNPNIRMEDFIKDHGGLDPERIRS
jgi:hypothetical protein